MASKDVAPLLAKEFVPVKLDFDRAKGAKEIEKRYIAEEQGLPWIAFLDADGKLLVHGTGPGGNVGFPAKPEEIAWFKTMLEKVKRHLTDEDIAFLVKSLEDANKKTP
jgi:hypothetical protein